MSTLRAPFLPSLHLPCLRTVQAGLLAGLLAAAPLEAAAAGPQVATLKVGAPAQATGFEIEGTVQALRQATVAAQIGGNVLALLVKAGDKVQAGQVLARIDDRDAAAGLSRTDAGVAQAEAELRNARTAAERTRELRSKGFISQAALDTAETQLKAAQSAAQAAGSARSQAALARGFATLTAPFAGVVLATHLEAGDLASPGRPVATLYAPGAMRAVVQVPASRAVQARLATRREVRLPAEDAWVQPLRSAELPVTDPVAQTNEWRLDLPAETAVQPGQSVTARFAGLPAAAPGGVAGAAPIGTPSAALSLPKSAVLQRGELDAVYLVRNGQFVLRAVRLGPAQGDQLTVLAGLKAGDEVAAQAVQAGLAGAQPAGAR